MGSKLEKIISKVRGPPHRGMSSAQRAEWLLSTIKEHDSDMYEQIRPALDRLALATPSVPTSSLVVRPEEESQFMIESLPDRYRLHNVRYLDELCTVDWGTELLDGGKSHGQEDWIIISLDTEWRIPSLPLYHATFRALYQNRKHKDKNQRQLVREAKKNLLREERLITSSIAKRTDTGKDLVIHDRDYPNEQRVVGYLSREKEKLLLQPEDTDNIRKLYWWAFNDSEPIGAIEDNGIYITMYHEGIFYDHRAVSSRHEKAKALGAIVHPNSL